MTRTFVMGDAQAPAATLMAVLDRHGALRGDRLADDVVLISIGDHFDYDLHDPVTAGREGLTFLRWLASHDPAQAVLLLGNHDAARVMELVAISDERFAQARAFARALDGDPARDLRFAAAFPDLPTPGLVGRDYASFSVAQRDLVRALLLAGRFHLARTGALPDGRPVVLSHAGVTRRELALLGAADAPVAIAAALEALLAGAIAAVRDDWARGVATPLSLAPVHAA
ncbi:MAG TPA: metallophosphoesterase, partial [Kofleriaceae bacterium]|nr:metallophosphoesterase [Kofleriaceae bacterium]